MDLICIDLRHLRLFEDTRRDLTSQAWREVMEDVNLTNLIISGTIRHTSLFVLFQVRMCSICFHKFESLNTSFFLKYSLVEFEEEDALAAMKRRDEDIEKQLSEASAACQVTSCELKNE